MAEGRRLPDSNIARNLALRNAWTKNDDLGIASFLTAATKLKLNTIQPLYKAAMDDVATKEALEMRATNAKDASGVKLKRCCSRFIQVFGLAVEDEEFEPGDFHFYHLDANGNVPEMDTDDKIKTVAENLITGEAARVAAGGAAMSNPAIAKIITLNTRFLSDLVLQNAAKDALKTAERAVNNLNAQADDAILFVWNEVETHYGNLAKDSQRAEGRLWGIVYIRVGSTKTITGRTIDSVTLLPVEGADVQFENGNNVAESNALGEFTFTTTLMDVQNIIATQPLYENFTEAVTLVEGENMEVEIRMVKKP